MSLTAIVVLTVIIAFGFDVINGFHDAANSIATVVSTRVLKPQIAVLWAAFFNFVAMFVFQPKVADTISKIVKITADDPAFVYVVLTGLLGAIGCAIGFCLMLSLYWIFRRWRPANVDRLFRRAQLVSAAFYSLGHGGNDAQKTMGVIVALLVSGGMMSPE